MILGVFAGRNMKKNTIVCLTIFLLGHLVSAERLINEIPMYGGRPRTEAPLNPEASRHASMRGFQYFYSGDISTAIKRFNQAWLLDTNNAEAYWGFGIIMGQRASQGDSEKNLKESIRFLQMANEKEPKNGKIIGDLAFSHTILGHYYQTEGKGGKENFEKAGKLFIEAFKADPKYPPIVGNWSVFYFYTGDYKKAKSKADEAVRMGYQFSPDYIKDLEKYLK